MKLIIGLGNPGKKYEYTRHNVGFMFLDELQKKYNFSDFKEELKFKGMISVGEFNEEKIVLVKPLTYMNLSGDSIRKVVDFYKIPVNDCIVVFDDISMEFGKVRMRADGSSGGHNGMKSIIQHFSEDFKRIKVGIGNNDNYDLSDWVLAKFTKREREELIKTIFPEAEKHLI